MRRKLNKKDYSIGQEVALLLHGNKAIYKEEGTYIKGEITKIGNKLIYIKNKNIYGDIVINMETSFEHSQYTPDYIMFDSEAEIKDYLDSQMIIKEIRDIIGQYGTPNIKKEKLEKILELLNK